MVYREAKDLRPNDSLMAIYKKYNRQGYEEVKSTIENSWKYTYWLADEYNIKNQKYSNIDKQHVSRHHVDHDKYNNNPNNIIQMTREEHMLLHAFSDITSANGGKSSHRKHPDLWEKTLGTDASKEKALNNSLRTRNKNKKLYLTKLSESLKKVWTEEMRQSASARAIKQWKEKKFSKINRKEAIQKTHLHHTCKVLYNITNKLEITETEYQDILNNNKNIFSYEKHLLKIRTIKRYFNNSFDDFVEYYKKYINENPLMNHRVISIQDDGIEDVYDFTVDEYHNFLLGAGVFVHNCHKTVRNALLELQQFKSINGRKFPNLKIIWGAVNPAKKEEEDADYDVEELDPAQLDRFHIIVELPNSPSLSFFKKKYGDYKAKILCDWWAKQPKEALKILSPRRLDYIGESFLKGLDIKYLLPESANVRDLVQQLSTDETVVKIKQLLENPTDDAMKEFLSNDDNFLKCKNELQNSKYWKYWKYINKEFVSQEMKGNTNFENYIIYKYISNDEFYKDIVDDAIKTDNNYKIGSIIKILQTEKFVPSNETITNFLSIDEVTKNLPKIAGKSSGGDNFSNSYHFNSWLSYREFDPSVIKLNTNHRKELLGRLERCFANAEKGNPYLIINFVISSLMSMQHATIKSINNYNFENILGSTLLFATRTLDSEKMKLLVKIVMNNIHKLNHADKFKKFVDLYDTIGTTANHAIVPEDLLKKINTIRTTLQIAGIDFSQREPIF